jgi:capsular polysaccharide biosynthesis protein/Mrp family chromosome partitioning ATPase
MNTSMKSDSLELADYIGAVQRRWRIVVALTVIGLVVAGIVVKVAQKSYTATASVYVAGLASDPSRAALGAGGPVNMDNEAQLIRSRAVAELVAQRLHGSSPPVQLTNRLSVAVPPNTTVLDINCEESTANRAADCANAFAAAYLDVRLANATGTFGRSLTALRPKVNSIASQIGRLRSRLGRRRLSLADSTALRFQLSAARSLLYAVVSHVNALATELSSLRAPNNALAGHVVRAAVPPASPSSPSVPLVLASGTLVGLLAGLLAAFVADWRDPRLHSSREVERFLGVPVLLDLKAEQLRSGTALAAPGSEAQADFFELAHEALAAQSDGALMLLVIPVSAGAGAGVVAADLASTLSEMRSSVVLISAADEAAVAPRLLGAADGRGLSELFAGEATISQVAQTPAQFPDLRVICQGARDGGTQTARTHEARRAALAELRSDARYVVVEMPDLGRSAETLVFLEYAQAAIIVIERSSTKRADVEAWLRRLERLRIDVLGAVVVAHLPEPASSPVVPAHAIGRNGPQPEPASPAAPDSQGTSVADPNGVA